MKLLVLSLVFGSLLLIPMSAEAKIYENDRYSFEYPSGCKLEKKENRFSSTDATLECKGDAGVNFESSMETSESLAGSSDEDLVTNLESVFELNNENTGVVETGTDKYIINNFTAPYVIGTYDQEFSNAFGLTSTESYVLMTMLIKLHDNEMVMLQYRNTEDDFDKQLPMVEKIFQSVKPLGDRTEVTETTGTESKYEYDDRLTPEENAEIEEYCSNPTNQIAKDMCDFIS